MLPSSHLIFHESPDDAARRIAKEQLTSRISGLVPKWSPRSTAEALPRRPHHWDIEFLFHGEIAAADVRNPRRGRVGVRRSAPHEQVGDRAVPRRCHESAGHRFGGE